jgi:hypothetical protein
MRDPSGLMGDQEAVTDTDVVQLTTDGYWGVANSKAHAINFGPAVEGDATRAYLRPTASVWPGQGPRLWGPSSQHPGGIVAHVLADNHTIGLSDKVDATVYFRLISRNLGEPSTEPK